MLIANFIALFVVAKKVLKLPYSRILKAPGLVNLSRTNNNLQ
jgi:hypothetical protein